ncbi:MAG: O-antigen ligase family protein [Rhizomicrobium sp.]
MALSSANNVPSGRRFIELVIACALAVAMGTAVGLMSDLSVKYEIATIIGLVGAGFLILSPDRRIWCLILWILIMPLSIEKVFYVPPPIAPEFMDPAIVINAGDALLVILFAFLVVRQQLSGEKLLCWPKVATVFSIYCVWAIISYLIHATVLRDGLVDSSPLALLHLFRTLVFIVLIYSAVRSRGDAVLVLLAIMFILLFESILVGVSYVTGHILNFTALIGGQPNLHLQTYAGDASDMVRGNGTLGQTNEQATFETFYALFLLSAFGLRNRFLQFLAVIVLIAASMAILLTFSRSAWLSYALALVVAFFIFLRKGAISKGAWLTGAGAAILIVVVLGALASPIFDRISKKGDEGATNSRLRMIHVALDLARAYPIIGVGPGEYPQAGLSLRPPVFQVPEWVALGDKPIEGTIGRLDVVTLQLPGLPALREPLSVHNKFLLCLAELGVVGLLLWLMVYWLFFRDALKCARSKDPFFRAIGIAGIAYFAAAMIYMNLDLFDNDKSIQLLIFIPLLVTAVARCVRDRDGGSTQATASIGIGAYRSTTARLVS